ncbi:hypothetical protein [Candidatus Hecatella orcuttiae]|uniref:hypothetical protein n=1 Tax=Candidatus Hecatella orcuttiae TaxID=1935119 RepID=UPI002867C668|nr:hypothetical protein [Candidatus Hecatella orcuttiae]
MTLKDFALYEHDWRGIIALTLVAGYILLLWAQVPGIEVLSVAVGLVVGWYFGLQQHPQPRPWAEPSVPLKLRRATVKHPAFKSIKTRLVEALRQTGCYDPAFDDMVVDEVVKSIIDIRTVDRYVEGAKDLRELAEAFNAKATITRILYQAVEQLAVTRRGRLKRKDMEGFKDTLFTRLRELTSASENNAR